MARKIIQDIIPPEKKGIRQIPVPDRHHAFQNRAKSSEEYDEVEGTSSHEVHSREHKRKATAPKVILWTIAVLAIIFAIFSIFSIFTQAVITITPDMTAVKLDRGFTAYKSSDSTNALTYQIVTIKKTNSETVSASGEEAISKKATGKIVVYNNYSSSSQKLIKNTRFETPAGLIYRIPDSIVVPGRVKKGSTYVPGSVETVVNADEAGDKYNIGLSDFTIPGFKGDPKFQGFYARSKTPLDGGLVGTIRKVESTLEATTTSKLDAGLRDMLIKEAISERPEGFIMFDNANYFDYKSLAQSPQGSDKVTLTRAGTLYGVLFENKSLALHIGKTVIPGFGDKAVYLDNPAGLTFSSDNAGARPWEDSSLNFHLKGDARIVSSFDETALKNDLAGQPAGSLTTVMPKYSGIKDAKVTIRPFWQRVFPDDVSKIKVKIEIPN